MKLQCALDSHIGRRQNNEDSGCAEPGLGFFAVADGMGGYEGGEVASQIAIETLRSFVRVNHNDDDCTWPYKLDHSRSVNENMLLTGARIAHEQIKRRRVGELSEMGSTLAAMLTDENSAVLVHVGDSRVYRVRQGEIVQLTRDHSLYEEMRESTDNMPALKDFPYGNIITRALGLKGTADVRTVEMQADDVYLLCSDGLSDVLSSETMAALAARCRIPEELSRELVRLAYEAGGRDNITALVVRCNSAEAMSFE